VKSFETKSGSWFDRSAKIAHRCGWTKYHDATLLEDLRFIDGGLQCVENDIPNMGSSSLTSQASELAIVLIQDLKILMAQAREATAENTER
jgi:hypothetical protein